MLQFHCHNPLFELGEHRADRAFVLTWKQVLGQLLCDSAAATAAAMATQKCFKEHSEETARVYA